MSRETEGWLVTYQASFGRRLKVFASQADILPFLTAHGYELVSVESCAIVREGRV